MLNFKDITYLKSGNIKQQLAYQTLNQLNIFDILQAFQPILAGTIPIEIDLPDSDLDIICYVKHAEKFIQLVTQSFGNQQDFDIKQEIINSIPSIITTFKTQYFIIEIFGQNIPTECQNAYRHMLIEYQILNQEDLEFKKKVMELKSKGLKTEPAFAKLLCLKGNPYEALLKYEVKKKLK